MFIPDPQHCFNRDPTVLNESVFCMNDRRQLMCVCRLTASWCTTGTGWPSSRLRARSSPTLWRRRSSRSRHSSRSSPSLTGQTVEGLYCKRPIQCLASSKILTPHRPVCVYPPPPPPPPLVRGRTLSLGGEGGGGQYFRRRRIQLCRYSTYVSTLWVRHSLVNQSTSFVRMELNCSPTLAPLNPRRPNLRLSSTEAMASPPHFFLALR
jgi:hypothetical protein